jgi:regulation of enolase protein 1 (concanavalin A-like superfamily)
MNSKLASALCLALVLFFASKSDGEDSKSQELTVKGWGGVIDPDGDCKFTIAKGSLRMSLPGTDHSLAFERGIMNAPRALRNVTGDFIAQVEVSGDYPAKASSLISNRRPFHGAGLLVWLDEENYIRLERAKLVFDGENMSYVNFEYRQNGEFVRKGDASQLPIPDGTSHVRIERFGSTIFASVSEDGVQWTAMDQIEIDMPQNVSVGVAAGHNTSSPFEPEFKTFKLFSEQAQ